MERDRAPGAQAARVVRDRPAAATDSCWVEGRQITDQSTCRALFPYYGDARIAAGGPQTDDVVKCELEPLDRADYGAVFTDAQWERLKNTVPSGVCDYARPGVGQEPPLTWPSFASAPGGRGLGPPPKSQPLR
jgi:hypothetical protein